MGIPPLPVEPRTTNGLASPCRRTRVVHRAKGPLSVHEESPPRTVAFFPRNRRKPSVQVSWVAGGRLHRRATRFDPEHQVGASADDGGCDAIGSIGCRQNEPCRYGLTLPGGELRPSLPFKPVFLISRSGSLDRLDQNE